MIGCQAVEHIDNVENTTKNVKKTKKARWIRLSKCPILEYGALRISITIPLEWLQKFISSQEVQLTGMEDSRLF